MTWLVQHRYLTMLVALLLLLVGFPISRDLVAGRLVYDLIYTAVFASAVIAVFRKRTLRRLAILLGAPTVVFSWIATNVPDLPALPTAILFHLFAIVFLVFIVVTVLQSIYNESRITSDGICGAFCGYLVVGIVFGHAYCLIEAAHPGSFRGPADVVANLQIHEDRYFLLIYFSLVTLATVGYGDITPATELTRSLAVVEAIVGQFYIAVLIADLIGKKLSQAVASPHGDLGGPP
jgi:voltage-gated potassium channel